jgi:hypothetical protein
MHGGMFCALFGMFRSVVYLLLAAAAVGFVEGAVAVLNLAFLLYCTKFWVLLLCSTLSYSMCRCVICALHIHTLITHPVLIKSVTGSKVTSSPIQNMVQFGKFAQ